MSELGNMIRQLRGERTQRDFAKMTRLNVRTIQRIEDGGEIKMPTIRAIVKNLRLPHGVYVELLVLWLKQQAGDEAGLVSIEGKSSSGTTTLGLQDVLCEKLKKVPVRYHAELLTLLESKDMLNVITHLNRGARRN